MNEHDSIVTDASLASKCPSGGASWINDLTYVISCESLISLILDPSMPADTYEALNVQLLKLKWAAEPHGDIITAVPPKVLPEYEDVEIEIDEDGNEVKEGEKTDKPTKKVKVKRYFWFGQYKLGKSKNIDNDSMHCSEIYDTFISGSSYGHKQIDNPIKRKDKINRIFLKKIFREFILYDNFNKKIENQKIKKESNEFLNNSGHCEHLQKYMNQKVIRKNKINK